MSYIVSADIVKKWLDQKKQPLVIIDTRYDLHDPEYGQKAYEKSHLPGAIYFDLEKHLSGEVKVHGGSHPLPTIEQFVEIVSDHGIDEHSTVVIYDAGADMFAARAWWMFHTLGHEKVYILDGGFSEWKRNNYPTISAVQQLKRKQFSPKVLAQTVHVDELKEKLTTKESILIDSRARERYLGKEEPLYKKAGHIPGATNYFWKDVFQADGLWKTPEQLQEHFQNLSKDKEIIVSCGSGVSACPNIVSLKIAGYVNVKLYPGSFSDWISYDNHPIETKDET